MSPDADRFADPKRIVTDSEEARDIHTGDGDVLDHVRPLRDRTNQAHAPRQGKSGKVTASKQMTLSLGKVGTSSFVECEICDTLYNTLHEADVKLHARRHAAVVKAGMGTGRRTTT